MFKILILQRYYNLSDDQVEYQLNDRMSFIRFLNLTISDDIPDSKTIWHFSEHLTDLGLMKGLIVNEGKIVDASFGETPSQRNNRDDKKTMENKNIINLEDFKGKEINDYSHLYRRKFIAQKLIIPLPNLWC